MMTPTLAGRLQTKAATYAILAVVAGVFALWQGPIFLVMAAIAVLVGLALEALWGALVSYQPGWMTLLFSLIEFEIIFLIGVLLRLDMTFGQALTFYLAMWIPIQLFLLYLLPVIVPRWAENGTELF